MPPPPTPLLLQVVPTDYQGLWGRRRHAQQYSVTEYYHPLAKGEQQPPAIFFNYDLSPIMVGGCSGWVGWGWGGLERVKSSGQPPLQTTPVTSKVGGSWGLGGSDSTSGTMGTCWVRGAWMVMEPPPRAIASPAPTLQVIVRETRPGFLHLLVRICAVVGGAFALTGMWARIIHRLMVTATKPHKHAT